MDESEERHRLRHGELESEVDELKREMQETIHELQTRSEEQLNQLKVFYETEKERLERRLVEEKDRATKRYNGVVEDYETKLKEEQHNHEDDVNMIRDDLEEKVAQNQDYITQLEHENSLKGHQIESLEKYLAETKESLNKIQSMNSTSLEQQLDKFNEERRELIAKIEKISGDLSRKERQITTFENQKETMAD